MGPGRRRGGVDTGVDLGDRLTRRLMQLKLLEEISSSGDLLSSDILPSIRPKVGRQFRYGDLERKKIIILREARKRIIDECAKVEAVRDKNHWSNNYQKVLNGLTTKEKDEVIKIVKKQESEDVSRLEKKKAFHLQHTKKPTKPIPNKRACKRQQHRDTKCQRQKDYKKKYRKRRNQRKQERLLTRIDEIKSTLVRNLSSVEVPGVTYLYLARGLSFVESRNLSKDELIFEAKEFLRKVSWKAYFKEKADQKDASELDSSFEDDQHKLLRIPSRKHPLHFHSPLFEEIKCRLVGFVSNLNVPETHSNLTPAEERGKAWLLKQVRAEKVFVTKADKGGATILMDWRDGVEVIRSEIEKPGKFEKQGLSVTDKMEEVRRSVNVSVKRQENKKNIGKKDRKLITGVNDNGNKMHSHVFRAATPYAYPLMKLHKLNQGQIASKVIPPARLVHATKEGPLYRLEKWCSPPLTAISRNYCEDEFLLDTPDLLSKIQQLNSEPGRKRRSLLFTLDVVSLYPSIQPALAIEAMKHAFGEDRAHGEGTKEALGEFVEEIFDRSFVTFEQAVFKGKEGIPTGNCISRQMADIFMHWLLFVKVTPGMLNRELVAFWKRFIDDILGIWTGTERQFNLFVEKLNVATAPFGIKFGDYQIGREVNFLDVKLFLDEDGLIQYRLYRKETDARTYLNPASFHPEHVFKSVIFSQMIRVIGRNSTPETCTEDLEELRDDLVRSGHGQEEVEATEPMAYERVLNRGRQQQEDKSSSESAVVFSFKYFKDANKLKTFVNRLSPDIMALCGEGTRTICAMRKHLSIGNVVVKNRRLSGGTNIEEELASGISVCEEEGVLKQWTPCGAKRCKTCPLWMREKELRVNGVVVPISQTLGCRTKNVIYLAVCNECPLDKGFYVGQTTQMFRDRMSGHRSKFKVDDEVYKHSALSFHCQLEHPDRFGLEFFKVGLLKSVAPKFLDREENIFINKLRGHIFGLNRIDVVR